MSKTVFGAAHAAPCTGYRDFAGAHALTTEWLKFDASDLLQGGDQALQAGDLIVEATVVNTDGADVIYLLERNATAEDTGVNPGIPVLPGQQWTAWLNGRDLTTVSVRSVPAGATGHLVCRLTRGT